MWPAVTLLLLLQHGAQAAKLQNPTCTDVNFRSGVCSLLVHCASFYAELAQLSRSPCTIRGDQRGVCCPDPTTPTGATASAEPTSPTPPQVQNSIPAEVLNRNCELSLQRQAERKNFEQNLVTRNVIANKGSPVYFHARLFETSPEIRGTGEKGALVLDASEGTQRELQMTPDQAAFQLPKMMVRETIINGVCPPPITCAPSSYRTVDGSCNNVQNPEWGKAGEAFYRLMPPQYADGLNTIRVSATGGPLPSARHLSAASTLDGDNAYEDYTLMVMQWGQFLDHDITHTPISKGSGNSDISCCNGGEFRPSSEMHPQCFPISIAPNDPFYGPLQQKCMEFVRSMPSLRRDCSFGPREQMNQITAYIDASNVYGSTAHEERSLRQFQGGRLRATAKGRGLLPPHPPTAECISPALDTPCFAAGDSRVNEQPNLAVLHTVWLRNHNQIATQLQTMNPGWSDETLYQETRRIVGAQMQHITYNEYLPIVLGRHFVETFGLVPLQEAHSFSYDGNLDATISNAFATAAFRYGHTLIDSKVEGYGRFGRQEINNKLSQVQFSPFMLYNKGTMDALVRGLVIQPSQKFDNFFSEELTNHLFARNNSFGMDLVALNLQRGRDHGLPPYVHWRSICKMPAVRDFADLGDVMHPETAVHLSRLYKNVNDIDLFLGAILEFPVAGALVGHTLLCILGDQFYRLKAGDRFFYEHGGLPTSFTPDQLAEVRKTSLARVLCDTSDNVEAMQPLAFLHANYTNKRASCKHDILIPRMSLEPWRS